jgi:hypothetical protein
MLLRYECNLLPLFLLESFWFLCYDNERDGKLQCAKTFDRWNSTYDYLRETISDGTSKERLAELMPEVHENAVALSDDNTAEYKSPMDKAVSSIFFAT